MATNEAHPILELIIVGFAPVKSSNDHGRKEYDKIRKTEREVANRDKLLSLVLVKGAGAVPMQISPERVTRR